MEPQTISLEDVLAQDVVKEKFLIATEIDIMSESLTDFPDELWQTIKNAPHNPRIRIMLPNVLSPSARSRAEEHNYALDKISKYYQQVLDLGGNNPNIQIRTIIKPLTHIYVRLNGGSIVGTIMNYLSESKTPIHGLTHECTEFHVYCKEFEANWQASNEMNYATFKYIQRALEN